MSIGLVGLTVMGSGITSWTKQQNALHTKKRDAKQKMELIMKPNSIFEKPDSNKPKPNRGRRMDLISGYWYDYEHWFTINTVESGKRDEK